MKVLATADLHGFLPEVPECDLLLIAGDVCPDFHKMSRARHRDGHIHTTPDRGEVKQAHWLDSTFREWLDSIPAKEVVGIAGNHDFVFENTTWAVPRDLRWHYLRDEPRYVQGLSIYGIPWVPELQRWAFYARSDKLDAAYAAITPGIDIVLAHGPPRGYCDHTAPYFGDVDAGADPANGMLHHVKPRFYVCGHIHEGFGCKRHLNEVTDVYNVAHVNEEYDESKLRPVVEIPVDR